MMDDRTMLELAAKAAGIRPCFLDDEPRFEGGWNPLTDDGDALRLAVKLGLVFDATSKQTWCGTTSYDSCEPHGNDPYAATRRAIVQAAAKIGKAKEG